MSEHITTAKTSKGEQRRKALLMHAIDAFIANGYEGTSLDVVIEKAGGSRSTVYQCYGNKEGLFLASLNSLVDDLYSAYIAEYRPGKPLREELETFGRIFLTHMTTSRAIGASRLIFAETARFPSIGKCFYVQGAEKSYHCFAKVLENELDLPFALLEKISLHYIEMLKSRIYLKALCLPEYRATSEEIEEEVQFCTDVMMAYIASVTKK